MENKILIKGIGVVALAPMENHIANGGEKLLGNASSIKRRPDGKVYISGQMQRQALFSAMDRLNFDHTGEVKVHLSNGDGTTAKVESDLRADLGGFLHTSAGNYSGRRTAPMTATPAVALETSETVRDLLVRLKINNQEDAKQKQALATNEMSQHDDMQMSFFLDVGAMGTSKTFTYEGEGEKELHIATNYRLHVKPEERLRRAQLFLESTNSITDYANQARNATSGEPQKVFIVLDSKLSRKYCRYFAMSDIERANLQKELKGRNAIYFYGDDTTSDGLSVFEAYQAANEALSQNTLFNPAGDSSAPVPYIPN